MESIDEPFSLIGGADEAIHDKERNTLREIEGLSFLKEREANQRVLSGSKWSLPLDNAHRFPLFL